MKIMLISKPRSRSNWFLNVLSRAYNTSEPYEPYRLFNDKIDDKYHIKCSLSSNDPKSLDQFSNLIIEINSTIPNNIAVKLQTSDIPNHVDLSAYNFHMYDKIYITDRCDIVAHVASRIVAHENNKWDIGRHTIVAKETPLIVYSRQQHGHAMLASNWDHYKMATVINWLTDNSIPFTYLDYEDVPDYCQKNFHNIELDFQKPTFKYQDIFGNWEDFINDIKAIYSKFIDKNLKVVYSENLLKKNKSKTLVIICPFSRGYQLANALSTIDNIPMNSPYAYIHLQFEKKFGSKFGRQSKNSSDHNIQLGFKSLTEELSQLIPNYGLVTLSVTDIPPTIDLGTYNIDQYDQVYITYRQDIVSSIACRILSKHFDDKDFEDNIAVYQNQLPITYDKSIHFESIISIIRDHLIMNKILNYLNNNNIKYNLLNHQEVPVYDNIVKMLIIDNNLNIAVIDYSTAFTNWAMLLDDITMFGK